MNQAFELALSAALVLVTMLAAWKLTATGRKLRLAESGLVERGYRLPEAGSVQREFVVARHARIPWRSQADMDAGVHWLEREGENARTLSEILRRR